MSQAAIALMMGTTMTLAFLIIRVPFGLLFGIAVGGMATVLFGGIAPQLVGKFIGLNPV